MAKKISVQEDPSSDEDPKIVAEVDEMMDPELPDEPETKEENVEPPTANNQEQSSGFKNESELPPLDIFADVPSAPPLETGKSKAKASKPEPEPSKEEQSLDEPVSESVTNQQDNSSIEQETAIVDTKPAEPDNYDDPKTAQAIDEIVAEESDTTLDVEDQRKAEAEASSAPIESSKGHPFFWAMVFLVCIIAIVIAVFLMYPSLHNPLSKIHWKSIRSHL